jgi:drug/metabolite transporter (DMT)-like permease
VPTQSFHRPMTNLILALFIFLSAAAPSAAQSSSTSGTQAYANEVTQLKTRFSQLERRVDKLDDTALVLFLFGVFCALWAQNTGRSAWLWFFLGLFGSVITVIVLLNKNSNDRFRESLRVKLDD